ncbi:MAG: peptidylprolyl isomerase [Deltaproteobacteria bacterium]|nr:peptidylprolyl isomerase [Deltaproteobacteria bacterium]
MKIEPNARVVLDYTLKNDEGELLDASDGEGGEPIVYVHGYGMLVPGLEAALVGLEVGATKDVVVPPDEGFGERDEELVLEVDRSEFPNPDDIEVGDELVAESPDGDELPMRVVEVLEDGVLIDANHPLAGVTLHYSVRVREVARATDEEVADAAEAFEAAGYEGADELPPNGTNGSTNGSGAHGGDGALVQLKRKPGKPSSAKN